MIVTHAVIGAWVLGQAEADPLKHLSPEARARLFGSLFLLTIGCLALVILTWLALRAGRRHLRRLNDSAPLSRSTMQPDDWASKPLAPRPPARPDAGEE
ncbi:MAG: hypothetical protein GXY58_04165 [Planctomycetaceae bacterium]|nr:hypothetical protein [Planctomycetaceae bacterium]